ncbi:MAG: Ig-like domain repeat protein, partial [Pyrinomonadaceae bacterium]|nr:Ig-like domain repeat protein [Pyrinomonadaceae bacterium]
MKTKKMRSKHVVPGPKSPDNFLKRNRWLLAMIVAVAAMVAVPLAKQQAQTEVDSDTKEALQRGSSQKVEANETGVITMTASQLENIPANVTGVSPGSGVDFGEESEPNDLFTSANPLSGSAGKIRGDIFPNGDEDWFSFTANTGDRVYAAVQTSYSNNGSSDSQLRVFASDGSTLLEFDDDDGVQGGLSSTVAGTVIPSNGTYYMQVKHFSATNSLRPYELYFRVQSGAPSTETESNDSPGTANSLPSNGWVSGARDPAAATEQDWFSFTANAGDTIYLGLDLDPERDNVQWNGRLGIALFGDANNQILVVDDGSTGSAANPLSEAMFMTVKNSGTYYGFVDSASAATGGPTATYNLSITRIPKTTVGVSCTTYTSTDVPKVIGPGAGLVSSTITVPPTMARIASTKVSITADHALMADMDVNLRSPNNNENGLFNDIGATATGGQTMMDLTLDQYSSGVPFLFTVVRPLVLKPELNYRLDWFDGENPSGVWTLDVRDDLTNTSGGNLTAWSLEVCEQAPVTGSVIYTEDFEANDGGFTHSGTADEWEYGTPATAATTTTNPIASIVGCNSGTNCWKTDLDNTYDVSSNQDLVSPSIAVPAGTNTLSWAMRYQMESANFDHARVLVREVGNPTNAKTVWEWRGATMTLGVGSPTVNIGESAGWGIHNADISAFAGMNVEIVFHLDSDSSIIFAGIAIDDVSIRNTPPGPTPTTTTINSIMPEPSVIGQDYSVNVTVSHGVMPLGGSPTGTVNVSDGTNNCMITLSGGSGSCDLPSTSPGAKTITANYAGNMSSAPSSDSSSHTVNPANTTTTITNAGPLGTPSIVGQPYPVNWSVTVDSPGAGTPTGTVTVTDGTDSCMAAVATGTCNLVSTTTGMKTIVATYNGDANFTSSNSPGVPHTVNPVPMTTVSINDVAQGEGNSGPSTMFFTVSLSAPSASPVSVDVTTEDVTATAGSDYIGKLSSTVTIPPGNTSAQFGVTIIGDTVPELDETFNVNLSNAVGAAIGDGQGVGTIENDDASSITINDVTVTEGNSGTTMATFTVTALP